MNGTSIRNSLQQSLGPVSDPVAVTFCDAVPQGIDHVAATAPAGCSFWKLAADGASFYTSAADHLNCPVGAYTHGAELPAEAQQNLEGMIGMMVGMQYLRMEEVAGIPKRDQPLRYVVYSPLSKTQSTPDVVIVRGTARQMMLMGEAASARNLTSSFPIMGRPACAAIPAALQSGKAVTSLGCIGNRVYTGLPDGEFYAVLPGAALQQTVEALGSIVAANTGLEQFHRERAAGAPLQ